VGLADQALAAELAQVVGQPGRGAVGRSGAEAVDQDGPQVSLGERREGELGTPKGGQEPHRPRRAEPETADALPPCSEGVTSRSNVERSKAVARATACAFWKRVIA
jgi:hypothetical protein